MEIIQSEEQKRKKNEKEGGKPKERIEHNQTDQYMNYRSPKREEKEKGPKSYSEK